MSEGLCNMLGHSYIELFEGFKVDCVLCVPVMYQGDILEELFEPLLIKF